MSSNTFTFDSIRGILQVLLACSFCSLTACAPENLGDSAFDSDAFDTAVSADPKVVSCISSPSTSHCDGLDPSTEGCDATASTWGRTTFSVGGATVTYELRYSTACHTNWGRAKISRAATTLWVKVRSGYPESDVAYGSGIQTKTKSNPAANTYYYTPMIYCPTGQCVASAGAKATYNNSTSSWHNTNWY